MKVTAQNIVKLIKNLPQNQWFDYVGEKSKTKVRVRNITQPEGPITIERYNTERGENAKSAKSANISVPMIWRIANAIEDGLPINFDRILGASYNTRSAFETLLAHTPEFYWCLPGRIEYHSSSSEIKRGHKHLVWLPSNPHKNGISSEYKIDQIVSELPGNYNVYESITPFIAVPGQMDIDVQRRHLQMQIAIIEIGGSLGFRTWIAHNDKGFTYGDKKIGELNNVVADLKDEILLSSFSDAIKAAMYIDCIWFKNHKFMPAVIEVEHSTGVTSGLSRMKTLQDCIPSFRTRWVVVAPDEDRHKVLVETNKEQFKCLNTQYLSYSSVEELLYLCRKRKLSTESVNESFLNAFMENCVEPKENKLIREN